MRLCLDRAGLVGGDGAVHQGFCDISILRVFPKMVLMAAMDEPSLVAAMEFMRTYDDGPSAVRYPRDTVSDVMADQACPPFEMGRARALVEHDEPDVAVFAYGVMAVNAMQAIDLLNDEYTVSVYDARFARPVDIELLRRLIESGVPVITVEDHGIEGGFGSCVVDACHEAGLDTRAITTLAIPCRWIYHGSRSDQLEETGLDPAAIARAIREAVDPSQRSVPEVTVTAAATAAVRG